MRIKFPRWLSRCQLCRSLTPRSRGRVALKSQRERIPIGVLFFSEEQAMALLLHQAGLELTGLEDVFICNRCFDNRLTPAAEARLADFRLKLLATKLGDWYKNPLREDWYSLTSVIHLIAGMGILLRAQSLALLAELYCIAEAEHLKHNTIGYEILDSVLKGLQEASIKAPESGSTLHVALSGALLDRLTEDQLATYSWPRFMEEIRALAAAGVQVPGDVFSEIASWRARAEEYLQTGTWDGDALQGGMWWHGADDARRRENAQEVKKMAENLLSLARRADV